MFFELKKLATIIIGIAVIGDKKRLKANFKFMVNYEQFSPHFIVGKNC